MSHQSWAEPWRVKMVEPLRMPSRVGRAYAISRAGYNTFLLRSDAVYMDRLSGNS